MADVIPFPTKAIRDWVLIERELDETLAMSGVSQEGIASIKNRMKLFYELLDTDFNISTPIAFPGSVPQQQIAGIISQISGSVEKALSEQLNVFTNRLFFDRLKREVEVCARGVID